jgi:hypothetical protein
MGNASKAMPAVGALAGWLALASGNTSATTYLPSNAPDGLRYGFRSSLRPRPHSGLRPGFRSHYRPRYALTVRNRRAGIGVKVFPFLAACCGFCCAFSVDCSFS